MLLGTFLAVNILILGHSFGADCTQNLPAIALEAGMNDVHIARFVKANCSLEEHWNYYQADSTNFFWDCAPGTNKFIKKKKTIRDVVAGTEWDYIIFQNSLENEGRYETVQPFLNNLIAEFDRIAQETGHKRPKYGWNLFWPISKLLEDGSNHRATYRLSFYENSSIKAFEAYSNCAREVLKNTDISFVIPVGFAIMNARASEFNTPEEKEFTRDGYHMSYQRGRWIAAGLWYQYFLYPLSGIELTQLPVGNALPEGLKLIAQEAAVNIL